MLARPWKEGGYLRLKCSKFMHFGFMAQEGISGKSAERVLEDRCRTVVSAVSGSTNLGPVPWAASLSSDFSCVEVATHIYPVVVVKVV